GQRLHLRELNNITSFTCEHSTSPTASALQWVAPEQTASGQHPFMYSQCQAIHARSIFPCQDTPALRFTYKAEAIVPAELIAVMAAGPGVSSQDGEIGSFRFEMPQSIPAYLFAIAVGNLTSQDLGPRSRIYAEPESVEAAAWEFEGMEERILAAEKLYGPYPWERYDMLLMPPSFPYGGMENPRLNFLTPTLVVGDRSLTSVISHELAHSWTGNLVTNATWDDFWLNEGWTTYAERRIMEITEGEDFTMMAATIGVNNLLAELDAGLVEPEMTRLKTENYDTIVTTFVPYEKGFLFLTAIERAVGREVFDLFTAKYIAAYKFQSLTTEEFLKFLSAELPHAFDLVDIDTWVHGTSLPEDMPTFNSSLMEVVDKATSAYQAERVLPAANQIVGWNAKQVELFLQGLPQSIPVGDCKRIEKL
ncbi:MAG: M1 family peptidase, partial [Chloroflexi bacterium]|nr:M1 family peptidase [Chloroflexota bacterium]